MKNILRHSVLSLLILSILLGSVGVAFSEQFCLMAGVRASELNEVADECCEQEKTANKEADDCCDEAVQYEKLEPVSSQKAFNLQLPVYFPNQLKPFLTKQAASQAAEQLVYTYTDSSPPLYGRKLLHKLHILIV
ncbi:HYC_CC_PP family protein [Pontibacter cellulosilyticus]|uniref:HYC_CC_PP family protein n=1 Tax=Pontibacter cellulosilyticus TaxID=1720253 RepID=UPI001C9B3C1F|nr:hypothetical protein [Pontibacter cellulosilyticus]